MEQILPVSIKGIPQKKSVHNTDTAVKAASSPIESFIDFESGDIKKNYLEGLQSAAKNKESAFIEELAKLNGEGFEIDIDFVKKMHTKDSKKLLDFCERLKEVAPENRKFLRMEYLLNQYNKLSKLSPVSLKNLEENLSEKLKYFNEAAKQTDVSGMNFIMLESSSPQIDAQKSIELLNTANTKVKNELGYILGLCSSEKFDIQKNGILQLNRLDEKYFNPENVQSLYKIFEQKTANAQKASVDYLNRIKDIPIDSFTLGYFLENDFSGSVNCKPFTKGTIAQTKEELRSQLYNTKNKRGLIVFTNEQVEKIVNSENKISEQSKILDSFVKHNAINNKSLIVSCLTKEGINFEQMKPAFEVLEELKTNPKLKKIGAELLENQYYYTLKTLFESPKPESLGLKNNIDVLDILIKNASDTTIKNNAVELLNILTNGKNSAETVQKLIDYGAVNAEDLGQAIELLTQKDFSKTQIANNLKLLEDLSNAKIFDSQKWRFRDLAQDIMKLDINSPVSLNEDAINVLKQIDNSSLILKNKSLLNFIFMTSKEGFDTQPSKAFLDEVCSIKNTYTDTLGMFDKRKYILEKLDITNILLQKDFNYEKALQVIQKVKETKPQAIFDVVLPELYLQGPEKYAAFIDKVSKYNEAAKNYGVKTLDYIQTPPDGFAMSERKLAKKLKKIEKFSKTHPQYFEQTKSSIFDTIHKSLTSHSFSRHKELAEYFEKIQQSKLKNYISAQDLLKLDSKVKNLITDKKQLDELAKVFACKNFNPDYLDGILQFNGNPDEIVKILNGFKNPESKKKIYYDKNLKTLRINEYSKPAKKEIIHVFDENLKLVSKKTVEDLVDKKGNPYQLVKEQSKNIETRLKQVPISEDKADSSLFDNKIKTYQKTEEVKKIKDASGKVVRLERSELSDIDGVVNYKSIDDKGRITTHSTSRVENGKKIVEKSLFNPLNGTRTEIYYCEDAMGSVIHKYKTFDKDGKVLLDEVREIQKTDVNNYISSRNGRKFRISHTENEITLFDFQKKTTSKIDLKSLLEMNKNQDDERILKNLLKELDGEDLVQLQKSVKKLILEQTMGSGFAQKKRVMYVGPHKFVFRHELGHALDNFPDNNFRRKIKTIFNSTGNISSIKELKKIYLEEKKLFEEFFGTTQKEILDYFIDTKTHYNGKWGGLKELISETNALLGGPVSKNRLSYRSHYLQEYFQKTIAFIAKRL